MLSFHSPWKSWRLIGRAASCAGVELGVDRQPGAGGGGADRVDDDLVAGQRPVANGDR